MKTIIEFHLNITKLRLDKLHGNKERKPLSIILKSQKEIVTNNNNQYIINE